MTNPKTPEQIVREAVDLADANFPWDHFRQRLEFGEPVSILEQHDLDVLAAQLVRQVDKLGGRIAFEHSLDMHMNYKGAPFETQCGGVEGMFGGVNHVSSKGPDRTMNTLTAIVESGVLRRIAGDE